MYLLDTNVISEIRKPSGHKAVVIWLSDQPPSSIFLPSVAFLELQRGIELTRLQNPGKAHEIETWVNHLERSANIANFDAAAARQYSRLGRRKPSFVSEDGMIAAIALTRKLTVVTRNVRDFEPFHVSTLNPFDHFSKRG